MLPNDDAGRLIVVDFGRVSRRSNATATEQEMASVSNVPAVPGLSHGEKVGQDRAPAEGEFDLYVGGPARGSAGFVQVGEIARPLAARLAEHLADKGVIDRQPCRESTNHPVK